MSERAGTEEIIHFLSGAAPFSITLSTLIDCLYIAEAEHQVPPIRMGVMTPEEQSAICHRGWENADV